MTGNDLLAGLQTNLQLVTALDARVAQLQAQLPASTTLGSAGVVSSLLVVAGFGAAYNLQAEGAALRADLQNVRTLIQRDVDGAAAFAGAEVSAAFVAQMYGDLSVLPEAQQRVEAYGAAVGQLGAAADLAAEPAAIAVDAAGQALDAAGNVVDTVTWWAKYGVIVVVVVVVGLLALLLYSPTAAAFVKGKA